MTNAMESYHLFQVHSDTLEPYTPTAGAYYITGGAAGTATGGTSKGTDDYVLLSLPPNFVGVISDGSLLWQSATPLDVARSTVTTGAAFTTPSPGTTGGLLGSLTRLATNAAQSAVPDFLPEDRAICERGQRAATGDFRPGQLVGDLEQVVVDFHHFLNERLHGVEPQPADA